MEDSLMASIKSKVLDALIKIGREVVVVENKFVIDNDLSKLVDEYTFAKNMSSNVTVQWSCSAEDERKARESGLSCVSSKHSIAV